ncbi:MAG: class II SORL domain-containing protein [Candidatus Aminicenantes bacterium]
MDFGELYQTADWKTEKHVPVIRVPESINKGEVFEVKVSVGEEVGHPNKTEHHIRWIAVYFKPEGEKFPYQIGKVHFTAHGESTQGPDTSTVYTHPAAVFHFKTDKPGTIFASSYCNIHGLWKNAQDIAVE